MKTTTISTRALAVFASSVLLLTANPMLRAADHKEMDHSHMDMKADESAQPGTAAAALEQIHHLHMELTEQVKGKNLKSVHETAEKLTAAANALPALSKDLSAEKQKRVEGTVKNLAKALDALHDAADEGNQPGSEKQLGAVDSLLKILSAQYPMGGMADHDRK